MNYSAKPQPQGTAQLFLIPLRRHLYMKSEIVTAFIYTLLIQYLELFFLVDSADTVFSNKVCTFKRPGCVLADDSRMLTLVF